MRKLLIALSLFFAVSAQGNDQPYNWSAYMPGFRSFRSTDKIISNPFVINKHAIQAAEQQTLEETREARLRRDLEKIMPFLGVVWSPEPEKRKVLHKFGVIETNDVVPTIPTGLTHTFICEEITQTTVVFRVDPNTEFDQPIRIQVPLNLRKELYSVPKDAR